MKKYHEIAGDGGSNILGQVQEQHERLQARMARIRQKIAIMSGKGGVGKSVVTVNLAAALAQRGAKVGVLDADINGPSLAKMLGVRSQALEMGQGGVVPTVGPLGVRAISMDLLLPKDETPVVWDAPAGDPFVWRGAIEASALREFLADTDWGKLDFLLIDLPPGPDRLPNFAGLLSDLRAVAVTIPSEIAQLTVKRSVVLAREREIPIVGLVENMAGYLCSECGALGPLFPGDGEELAKALGIELLGKIPFDPRITRSSDRGVPFVIEHGESPAAQAFVQIAAKIEASFKGAER